MVEYKVDICCNSQYKIVNQFKLCHLHRLKTFVQPFSESLFFCRKFISNLKLLDIYIYICGHTRTHIKNALNLADATKHAKFGLESAKRILEMNLVMKKVHGTLHTVFKY